MKKEENIEITLLKVLLVNKNKKIDKEYYYDTIPTIIYREPWFLKLSPKARLIYILFRSLAVKEWSVSGKFTVCLELISWSRAVCLRLDSCRLAVSELEQNQILTVKKSHIYNIIDNTIVEYQNEVIPKVKSSNQIVRLSDAKRMESRFQLQPLAQEILKDLVHAFEEKVEDKFLRKDSLEFAEYFENIENFRQALDFVMSSKSAKELYSESKNKDLRRYVLVSLKKEAGLIETKPTNDAKHE